MKKILKGKISRVVLVIILVTVFLISVGLWRHHYLKILNAEPKKMYKSTISQPNTSQVKPVPSGSIHETRKETDDTDLEAETSTLGKHTDNVTPLEKTDDVNTHSDNAGSGEKIQVPLSVEETVEIAAFRKYLIAQSEYNSAMETLNEALKRRPPDWEHLEWATDKVESTELEKNKTLRELAAYSEEAAKELAAVDVQAVEVESKSAERKSENEARRRSLDRIIGQDLFNALSPEEQRALLERLPAELKSLFTTE